MRGGFLRFLLLTSTKEMVIICNEFRTFILRFMIPILGTLILQVMYGAVDILMVGRFGTTTGISGVSTGSNVVNLVIFTIAGLSMGVTVIIGKYMGEKKEQQIGKVIGGSICFFFLLYYRKKLLKNHMMP